jgi:hypothetical protein
MTINQTAYDTTVGQSYQKIMDKTQTMVQQAIVKDYINYNTYFKQVGEYQSFLITGNASSEAAIPTFTHPFEMEYSRNKYLVVDVRAFVKTQRNGTMDNMVVKNQGEYDLAKSRLGLNLLWLDGQYNTIRDLSIVPAAVFCSWISESFSKRYALDARDQILLSIISCYYYANLFVKEPIIEERDKEKLAAVIIRSTKAPPPLVFQILERIEHPITNIDTFCQAVRAILENPRMDDFNPGLLVTILGNSWYGFNYKDLLAVALEHPPTWISIVYAALNDRGYRSTQISKIAERYAKSKGGDSFIKSLVALIKDISKSPTSSSY